MGYVDLVTLSFDLLTYKFSMCDVNMVRLFVHQLWRILCLSFLILQVTISTINLYTKFELSISESESEFSLLAVAEMK